MAYQRIAVLSDIHGNLPALRAVVADFTRRGVDRIINLGDSLSGPLMPLETARYLMATDWLHLAGNHERQVLTLKLGQRNASDEFTHSQLSEAELNWMAGQETSREIDTDIFACHATPNSDTTYFLETVEEGRVRAATGAEIDERLSRVDNALVLCGHTHTARSVRNPRGQLLLNPGSVGLPAYDASRPQPHVIETGSPDARYAIVEKCQSGWVCQLLTVPYDHTSMAKLAKERNRADWARALMTGRMS